MTWKAMSSDRVCDVVDFWIAVDWPRTPEQVQQLGQQIGWSPDEDEMMENGTDALSEPAVPIATMPTGETASFSFWVTDVVREPGVEADAFLDDQYALLVREAQSRWGKGDSSGTEARSTQWDFAGGARAVASRGERSVSVAFTTPQFAQVLRELGE